MPASGHHDTVIASSVQTRNMLIISQAYRHPVSSHWVSALLLAYQRVSAMYHQVSCLSIVIVYHARYIREYRNDLVCVYPLVSCRIGHGLRRGVYRRVSECIVCALCWCVSGFMSQTCICVYLDVSWGITEKGIWGMYHVSVSLYLCYISVVNHGVARGRYKIDTRSKIDTRCICDTTW